MMQRLKNYRERLARLQQMREKELAERRGGETEEQREATGYSKWERRSMSDVVKRPKNRERTGCSK